MEKSGKRTVLTVMLMLAATLLSKALGLFRDILLASNYGGSSAESIAFEAASRMPTLLFDFVIGGVVTAAFIPIFSEILAKDGKASAMRFANQYLNFMLLFSFALSALGIAFSPLLVKLIAPGLELEVSNLAVSLTRIMFPQVTFTALAFCYVGILQSLGEFNLPAVISLVSNLIVVLYYFTLNEKYGIYGLAVATVMGWLAQAAVQAPRAHMLGYRYSPCFDFRSPHIRRSLKMAFPILVSTWMQPFCNLINTRYASGIEGGDAITAIGFANRLYTIIVGIFSFVATNLIFPKLSLKTASGDDKEAGRLAASSVKILLTVIIPISAGVFILAKPLVRILFLRGEFTENNAALTALALSFFALGMPALAVNEVLTKLFFSRKNTLPPMLISLFSIAFDLVLVAVLSKTMGVSGIALATGITVTLSAVCHYAVIRKNGERLFVASDVIDILKIVCATLVMSAVVYVLYGKLAYLGDLAVTVISAVLGALTYALLLFFFPTKEVKIVKRAIVGGKNDKSN